MNFDWSLWLGDAKLLAIRVVPRLLAVILILLLLRYIVRWANRGTHRMLERVTLAPEAESLIAQFVSVAVIIFGFVVVLLIMGWGQLALSFVAGLGISGLVIGFALQDITKNFAAGLLLLFQRPFRIGDRISIGGDEGVVTDLSLRQTTLRTSDGRELLVPNATIYTGTITNLTRYNQRRHAVELTLKREVDLSQSLPALLTTLQSVQGLIEKPQPDLVVSHVKPEGTTLEARFWLPSQGIDGAVIRSNVALRLRDEAIKHEWLA